MSFHATCRPSLKRSVATLVAGALSLGVVSMAGPGAVAQTAAPQPLAASDAEPAPAAKPKVEKSQRLDKHAPPWVVIWHTRLWTDVPETQDFVKQTHPDPKTLEYAPLVGKDPDRPKPRDLAGIAALQAELEGDLAHNASRGKAINEIGAPKSAKTAKSDARAGRNRKKATQTAKAKSDAKAKTD